MRGSTFSPPKPNQGDNLHPLHVSGENKLWLLHIPLPVTHKIARERERSSPSPLQSQILHPLTPAHCFAFDTCNQQTPPSNPPSGPAEGQRAPGISTCQPNQTPRVICLKTLIIYISAREVVGNHSHRHWSISCPWHLCGLLVQLRQQL